MGANTCETKRKRRFRDDLQRPHTDRVLRGLQPRRQTHRQRQRGQTLKVWDVSKAQEILSLKGYTGRATSVAFSPDGERIRSILTYSSILTNSGDTHVKWWEASTGQEVLSLKDHGGRLWDVVTGQLVCQLNGGFRKS